MASRRHRRWWGRPLRGTDPGWGEHRPTRGHQSVCRQGLEGACPCNSASLPSRDSSAFWLDSELWRCGAGPLSHIYGPAFGRLETTSVLFGVAYVVIGFFLGPVLVLKATRRTRWLMHVQILGLIVSAVSMAVFCAELGVVGAADATIVTNVAYALAYRWCRPGAGPVGDAGAPPSGGPLPDGTVRVSALDLFFAR